MGLADTTVASPGQSSARPIFDRTPKIGQGISEIGMVRRCRQACATRLDHFNRDVTTQRDRW